MSMVANRSRRPEEGRASVRSRSGSALPIAPPADRLTDDLLVEILSRVPAKSLCRCKCVSKHWLAVIRHPVHRKRLPQTLAGFFYGTSTTGERILDRPFHFTSLSGDRRSPFHTSFAFLPNHYVSVHLLDSCNGLLLCRWHRLVSDGVGAFHYVVCNPATQKWVAVPTSGIASSEVATACLGFDPALSPHFHVFELVHENRDISGVAVYSSQAGGWVYKEKTWNGPTWIAGRYYAAPVFLDGHLCFSALDTKFVDCIVAVDTKGETWMKFGVPAGLAYGFIKRSQGRLHYAVFQRDEDGVTTRLVVYALENYRSKEWILKHSIETSNITGWADLRLDGDFDIIAIHPECNLVFFTAGGSAFMCYNMDNRQVKVVSYLADDMPLFLPYVPLYTDLQSLHI